MNAAVTPHGPIERPLPSGHWPDHLRRAPERLRSAGVALGTLVLVASLSVFGCSLNALSRVTEQRGLFTVVRDDRASADPATSIDQPTAEAAAIAKLSELDPTVTDVVVVQASLVLGLLSVADDTKTLVYEAGAAENDWVILFRARSSTFPRAGALVAVNALTGEVNSVQLLQTK